MDCIFCKIAKKEATAKILYEDENAIAFLDVMPSAPGHTMVIPKRHAPTLIEFSDAELAALFAAVKKTDELLVAKLAPDGMTIGVNQGKASGQVVNHLHVHLMPRWHNDNGQTVQSLVNSAEAAKRAKAEKRLLG